MSNIKEIAGKVGVSPASVSIYLNDKTTNRVSSETKGKIEEAVRELNYHKNLFASSLSSQESRLIGVIIPSLLPIFSNEYTNELLAGLQCKLSSKGYGMLFFPSSAHSSIEIVKEQLERSAGCDAYVLFSTGFCTMDQIRKNIFELQRTEKPFVTLNIPQMGGSTRQVLIGDLEESTGTRYLVRKGHRNILLLLGRSGGVHSQRLLADHERALHDIGVTCDSNTVFYGEYSADIAYEQTLQALSMHPDTTAICCMSDIMAAGAMLAIRKKGLRVPDDVSVIGRNNSVHAMLTTPLLTTVDLHMHEAGQSAADLILDAISGSRVVRKILISGTVIERESVKSLV